MASGSLQLVWTDGSSSQLWAWDQGNVHQVARVKEHLRNNIVVADLGLVGDISTHQVIMKISKGEKAFTSLQWEYKIYTGRLLHLQGSVIPRCFGLFKGRTNGTQLGCLLLEHVKPHTASKVNPDEFHRELMVALCKIHDAGIQHERLSTKHILQMGYSPRIIDFACATKHSCRQTHPVKTNGLASTGCKELTQAEEFHAHDRNGVVNLLHKANKQMGHQVVVASNQNPTAIYNQVPSLQSSFPSMPQMYATITSPPPYSSSSGRKRNDGPSRLRKSSGQGQGRKERSVPSVNKQSFSGRRPSAPPALKFQTRNTQQLQVPVVTYYTPYYTPYPYPTEGQYGSAGYYRQ